MCLAQGPQHSDDGEAQTSHTSVSRFCFHPATRNVQGTPAADNAREGVRHYIENENLKSKRKVCAVVPW